MQQQEMDDDNVKKEKCLSNNNVFIQYLLCQHGLIVIKFTLIFETSIISQVLLELARNSE